MAARGHSRGLLRTVAHAPTARAGVGKLSERLRAAGATAAAADEVGAALLAGFDPESALFGLPVLAEAARSLAAAARAARGDRRGLEVVVDLAGTPAAPYYTALTFALGAAAIDTNR